MSSTNPEIPSTEFMSLLTGHQADLWAFIISQIPGSPDVADVLQKTNLTLWTKQAQFELGTNFRAWAFAVARFEVMAHLKTCKRQNWLVFSDDLIEVIADEAPAAIPQTAQRLRMLESCMMKLRPEDRILLAHRYEAKAGLEAFAAKYGRSISGVSVTLHRVRNALRICIEKGIHEEGEPV